MRIKSAISNLIFEDDDLYNEFSQKVDHPCEICKDDNLGEFLKCEFNRDGDSYRYVVYSKGLLSVISISQIWKMEDNSPKIYVS
jgi:hypothetical protein